MGQNGTLGCFENISVRGTDAVQRNRREQSQLREERGEGGNNPCGDHPNINHPDFTAIPHPVESHFPLVIGTIAHLKYSSVMAQEAAVRYVTEEEYFALEEKSDLKHEYFAGEIFAMGAGASIIA
ncbi:MAG: hypothetical protein ACXW32_17355 [Limisphaerales bacterium]